MDDYKQLFEAYTVQMRLAREKAQAWWAAMLAREAAAGLDAAAADEALEKRWPLGAVSHPAVIATFREYALACQELNDRAEQEDLDEDEEEDFDEEDWGEDDEEEDAPEDLSTLEAPVEPPELLIQMLEGRADDLAEFLADFVFLPLGLDKNERWI